jgi:hypothetical protein
VTNVRRLVRVDRGVLDDRLFRRSRLRRHLLAYPRQQKREAIEVEIQVAVRRSDDTRHARNRADGLRELLRDHARRLALCARELKGDGHRQIAHRAAGRHFHRERRHIGDRILAADRAGDGVVHLSLNAQNHGCCG